MCAQQTVGKSAPLAARSRIEGESLPWQDCWASSLPRGDASSARRASAVHDAGATQSVNHCDLGGNKGENKVIDGCHATSKSAAGPRAGPGSASTEQDILCAMPDASRRVPRGGASGGPCAPGPAAAPPLHPQGEIDIRED